MPKLAAFPKAYLDDLCLPDKTKAESMSPRPPETLDARRALLRQAPAFLIIGSLGFCLDAAITIALVQGLAIAPQWARLRLK